MKVKLLSEFFYGRELGENGKGACSLLTGNSWKKYLFPLFVCHCVYVECCKSMCAATVCLSFSVSPFISNRLSALHSPYYT